MRSVDAPGDLADLIVIDRSVFDIARVAEEVGGQLALIGIIVSGLRCAVRLGPGSLCHPYIRMWI